VPESGVVQNRESDGKQFPKYHGFMDLGKIFTPWQDECFLTTRGQRGT